MHTCTVSSNMSTFIGRLMRLTYFATPYELVDLKHPGQDLKFSNESKQ